MKVTRKSCEHRKVEKLHGEWAEVYVAGLPHNNIVLHLRCIECGMLFSREVWDADRENLYEAV